jgi:tetratricopeptide (TPR) repeat protein
VLNYVLGWGIQLINKSKIVKDAQKFVTKGQLDKAIAEFSKIVAATPNDSNTHNTIGDLYLKLGNKAKAIESFKAAADVLNKDGFTLKAIALYKKVLNINPDQVDVLMLMGKLNAERGMLGNANENYLAAVNYFTKHGKRDRALEIYKILCNLNPKNIALAQKLADLYMSEGMEKEGISKFVDLADIKAQDGEFGEAKQFLDRIRQKASDRQDFMKVSSFINLKEGRVPEAIEELEKLRILDASDTKGMALLCDAYLHSGRYEEAAELADELLENDPGNAEYRKKLIDIHIKSGDFAAAWEQYRDQVEIYIDKKEYNKAQKLIQEYLEHNKDSIEARQVLADMYASIGREDKISELHQEMAEIYANDGDTEKAYNIYSKLLEHDPDNQNYKTAIANLGQTEAAAPPVVETGAEPQAEVHTEEHAPEAGPPGQFDVSLSDITEQPHETIEEEVGFPSAPLDMPSEETSETEEAPGEGFLGLGAEEPPVEEPATETVEEEGSGFETGFGETGNVYDLSEMPEELPPLDFGTDAGSDLGDLVNEAAPEAGVYEIDEEAAGIEGLDIFGVQEEEKTAFEDEPVQPETPEVVIGDFARTDIEEPEGFPETGGHEESEAPEAHAYQDVSSLEESLTEADVYIKYGLYPKAYEVLGALDSMYPGNPDIQARFIDICKSQNDMDGFVERSLQLASILKSKGLDDEADEIIANAVAMDPDDERLRLYTRSSEGPEVEADTGEEDLVHADAGKLAEHTARHDDTGISPGSVGFLEELAEADFYANQGLNPEAMAIYRRLLTADPENDSIREKYNSLLEAGTVAEHEAPEATAAEEAVEEFDNEMDAAFSEINLETEQGFEPQAEDIVELEPVEEAAEAKPEAPAEPEIEVLSAEEPASGEDEDFFDLAAELREEMGTDIISPSINHSSIEDNNLDAVFQEFRRGVNEQLDSEDYETHYNLGIAYKEMGMIDEALTEFIEASNDASRALECSSMIGLCHLEKGEYKKAIEHFKKGLEVKGRDREEYFGLRYDMATAYELSGDPASAFSEIDEIFRVDQEFRDVKKRHQRLSKSASTQDDAAQAKDAKTRKSRVSYL